MLIFDLHLDLALSAIDRKRDLLRSAADARATAAARGEDMPTHTVALPEMRRGHIGLCIATLIARVERGEGFGIGYRTHEAAFAVGQGMLAYYRQLERLGVARIVRNRREIDSVAAAWDEAIAVGATGREAGDGPPFGFVIGTEGADCIVSPSQLPLWWDDGLRVVSLVHFGVSKYAHGTNADGPLTADGKELLRAMEEAGAILDLSHLCDVSFWEALERFRGPVFASHNNCRALMPTLRQFTDDQIRAVVARGGLIGPAPSSGRLADFVDHIDHICQLAGNARHAAIGSDLNGGTHHMHPAHDIETIADMQGVAAELRARGYADSDVANIMSGNALRFFRGALPAT